MHTYMTDHDRFLLQLNAALIDFEKWSLNKNQAALDAFTKATGGKPSPWQHSDKPCSSESKRLVEPWPDKPCTCTGWEQEDILTFSLRGKSTARRSWNDSENRICKSNIGILARRNPLTLEIRNEGTYNWNESVEEFDGTQFCYSFHDYFGHELNFNRKLAAKTSEIRLDTSFTRQCFIEWNPIRYNFTSIGNNTEESHKSTSHTCGDMQNARLINRKFIAMQKWIDRHLLDMETSYLAHGGVSASMQDANTFEDYELILNIDCWHYDKDWDHSVCALSIPLPKQHQYAFGRGRSYSDIDHYASSVSLTGFDECNVCPLFRLIFGKLECNWNKMIRIGVRYHTCSSAYAYI